MWLFSRRADPDRVSDCGLELAVENVIGVEVGAPGVATAQSGRQRFSPSACQRRAACQRHSGRGVQRNQRVAPTAAAEQPVDLRPGPFDLRRPGGIPVSSSLGAAGFALVRARRIGVSHRDHVPAAWRPRSTSRRITTAIAAAASSPVGWPSVCVERSTARSKVSASVCRWRGSAGNGLGSTCKCNTLSSVGWLHGRTETAIPRPAG